MARQTILLPVALTEAKAGKGLAPCSCRRTPHRHHHPHLHQTSTYRHLQRPTTTTSPKPLNTLQPTILLLATTHGMLISSPSPTGKRDRHNRRQDPCVTNTRSTSATTNRDGVANEHDDEVKNRRVSLTRHKTSALHSRLMETRHHVLVFDQ